MKINFLYLLTYKIKNEKCHLISLGNMNIHYVFWFITLFFQYDSKCGYINNKKQNKDIELSLSF